MTPLDRLYFGEVWKTLKRPMTWTLGILLAGVIVLVYATLIATLLAPDNVGVDVDVDPAMGTTLEESLMLPDGLYMGAGLVQLILTAMIIVLAAGVVGSELSWGTIRTMLMMGAGRTPILIAKMLALVTIGLIGMVGGLILSILGSLVTAMAIGESIAFSSWLTPGLLGEAFLLTFRAMIGVLLWAAVAATITMLSRSLAAGIGASLALLFLGGQIGGMLGGLGDIGTWLSRALPNAGVDALTRLNALTPPEYSTSDWGWILANIIGWLLLLAIASVVTFRRMDTLAAGS